MGLALAVLISEQLLRTGEQGVAENRDDSREIVIMSAGGTFEAAQKHAFFEPFTRDTGIKITLVPEDNAKLLTSVMLGKPDADITFVSGGAIANWTSKHALEKIDYNIFSKDTLAAMDPKTKMPFGVGAYLYATVIAFNTTKFGNRQPKNWMDFYNVKDFPGKRSLPKCEKILDGGLLEGALLGDGVPPRELYPIDMNRAFAKLSQLNPNVGRWWVSGADAPQSLISGEVDMAAAYSGRISSARKQGAPLSMSWEQSLVQMDFWVVAKNSPNKRNAMKFLAYISRPEPQAAFAETMLYGPINGKAFKLVPHELLGSLPGAPGLKNKQVFQNYDWWNTVGSNGRTNLDVALERCVAQLSQ